MFDSISELVKRFFEIKSAYIKATVALFLLAVFINSGILLFIPGLHPLQYPTFALIYTLLGFLGTFFCSMIFIKFEDGKAVIAESTYFLASINGLFISCFMCMYFIAKYIKECKEWHIAAFLLSQVLTLFVITLIFILASIVVLTIRKRNAKRKLQALNAASTKV